MGKRTFFVACVLGVCALISVAGAQLYPNAFNFVDVKSATQRVHLFGNNGPKVHYLNFQGGATINSATSALDVGTDWASPSPTPAPSSGQCYVGIRNQHYTIQGAAGVKDLTYQCCKTTGNTYVWLAGYCQ